MSTGLIIGWVYKKGELARQQLDNWIIGITAIVSILLTVIFIAPALKTNIPYTGKVSKFLTLFALVLIIIILYYVLKLLADSIFVIYQKIKGIQEEEILFTDNKITSTNKRWTLNDAVKKLDAVDFSSKNKELVFKVIETMPGKTPVKSTIHIPVPHQESKNAQIIQDYFKNKLTESITPSISQL